VRAFLSGLVPGVILVAEFKITAPLITAQLLASDSRFELGAEGILDRGTMRDLVVAVQRDAEESMRGVCSV